MTSTSNDLDLSARYQVKDSEGIAYYLKGYKQVWDAEYGEYFPDEDYVIAVMVGDDREWTIDVDDLIPLDEDGFCRECGQVGCMHGR